ncbi:MAG: cytochrome c oxidase subunit II [Aggregatilineales bacterium]
MHNDSPTWKGHRSARVLVILIGVLMGGCSGQLSILDPHGPSADRIATLTWILFGTATVVFIIVVAILLVAIFRRRQTQGELPPANDRRLLTFVLVAGGFIPATVLLILMGLGVFTETTLAAPSNTPQYTIEIIGHQWWWEVHYPNQGIVTADEVHVPVGQAVYLKLTSADVIHSFWVPQLKEQQDMIPGETNTIWLQADQAGTYYGECNEYCGPEHAKMKFVLVADKPADFAAWVKAQQQTPPPPTDKLAFQGREVLLGSSCDYCHTIQGTNASGKLGPDLTHFGSRLTIGAGIMDNNIGNLGAWIVNSQTIKPANKMPPMDLNGDELQAVLAYLESLK